MALESSGLREESGVTPGFRFECRLGGSAIS